jgi:hypothetical protein
MQHAAAYGKEEGVREAMRQGETMADAELEACCEWLTACNLGHLASNLRKVRRPAPPTLREQALALLKPEFSQARVLTDEEVSLIRKALQEGAK